MCQSNIDRYRAKTNLTRHSEQRASESRAIVFTELVPGCGKWIFHHSRIRRKFTRSSHGSAEEGTKPLSVFLFFPLCPSFFPLSFHFLFFPSSFPKTQPGSARAGSKARPLALLSRSRFRGAMLRFERQLSWSGVYRLLTHSMRMLPSSPHPSLSPPFSLCEAPFLAVRGHTAFQRTWSARDNRNSFRMCGSW